MGGVAGMLGLGGQAGGSGFGGPGASSQGVVGITNPVNQAQLDSAQTASQGTLQSQQDLLKALQSQQGLQNQNQVYQQLQGVANGTGPNPAQAQYQKNISDLAAQQAGAIGSIKGISPALQAEMIARQGGAAAQNAAGQGAANLATQQLGAMNQAGQMANTMAGNQIGQTNANVGANQAQQQMLLNAQAAANNANVGMQSNINSNNASLANTQMQGQQGFIGGVMNGGAAALHLAGGGEAQKMALGGDAFSAPSGPQSKFGQFVNSGAYTAAPQVAAAAPIAGAVSSIAGGLGGANNKKKKAKETGDQPEMPAIQTQSAEYGEQMAGGAGDTNGMPPAITHPYAEIGDGRADIDKVEFAAQGGMMAHDYSGGGHVKAATVAQKAVKTGNSYANDKIPAVLSEGEVVIPRNVMQSGDPVRGAAQFVQAVLAKRKVKG